MYLQKVGKAIRLVISEQVKLLEQNMYNYVCSYMSSFPYCSCDTAADTITMGTGKPEHYEVLNTVDVVLYTNAYPSLTA